MANRLNIGSEFAFGLCILAQISILIIPIPPSVLDIALAFSFLSSILILLVSLSIRKPVDFSALPTLLLLTTLLRLCLNVATSRRILSHGNDGPESAGQVVAAFGGFLMGGDVLIGVVVFIMILLVNFAVITKGASRIAEVSARFYLDSMPGKQMAIDADLSSGLIDETLAQVRRANLAEECGFYGSMDGASKFVRGDAICALIITLINICGGLTIGILRHKMSFQDAVSIFSTLTIGDGLVSQVPAIFVSTAAAIVVAKGAADDKVHGSLKNQLGSNSIALTITAAAGFALALPPNFPTIPFLILSFFGIGLAYRRSIIAQRISPADDPSPTVTTAIPTLIDSLDLLRVELGYGLLNLAGSEGRQLPDQIRKLRRTIANELGFIIPPVNIQDNGDLGSDFYSISVKNIVVGTGELRPLMMLAISPGESADQIHGEPTSEPTFGLPATWILPNSAEQARLAGWTVVDPTTVITTHLSEIIRENIVDLFTYADVQILLNSLPTERQKLVADVIPAFLSLGGLQRLLQSLLSERISIRDLPSILEAVLEYGQMAPKSSNTIVSHVRSRLARQISEQHLNPSGYIPAIILSTEWEEALIGSLIGPPDDRQLTLGQEKLLQLIDRIRVTLDRATTQGEKPILITNKLIRSHVHSIVERVRLVLPVLAQNEIHRRTKLRVVGIV